MSTLGQKPATQHVSFQKQTITGNGGTSYTLQQSVGSELDISVFVNNTRQEPTTAYTASGTSLVMTGAVNASDHFYVIFLAEAINTTGLPVSAVNTASINALAVTNAKIANSTIDLTSKVTGILPAANGGTGASTYTSGKTLAITKFTNNTRTSLSETDVINFFDTSITQVKANSKFIVHVHLHGWQDYSGAVNHDLIYDGTTHSGVAGFTYTAQDYWHHLTGTYYTDGASTAGSKNFKFRQDSVSGGSQKWCYIWNPNAADDARLAQTISSVIFIEYDL